MNEADRGQTPAPLATAPTPWTLRTSALALVWSACVFTAYIANGREMRSGDTIPAKYLTFALVRGDGFYLDRYRSEAFKVWPNPGMPYYLQTLVSPSRGLFVFSPWTIVAAVYLPFAFFQLEQGVPGPFWASRAPGRRDPCSTQAAGHLTDGWRVPRTRRL